MERDGKMEKNLKSDGKSDGERNRTILRGMMERASAMKSFQKSVCARLP